MTARAETTSNTFIWRRIHSLMGLWLIIYLLEHLIVNSQATLWIGDDGSGFVRLVDSLESLPFLQVIEVLLIGIPLAIHMFWGVKRIFTAKANSLPNQGNSPSLKYGRNRAFTWQRLTSWILLFGVIGHVVQMRFLDMPKKAHFNQKEWSLTPLTFDEGLYTLAARLDVTLYNASEIRMLQAKARALPDATLPSLSLSEGVAPTPYDEEKGKTLVDIQKSHEEKQWLQKLGAFDLKSNQVLAIAPLPGKAILLKVRDTFKNPIMAACYTLFVLAAAFHAFNGFWTALITWGAVLSYRSQKAMLPVAWIGMGLLAFLGLAAIWGSYWINLRT
jgi:succinate dehydrogenase / fumarate reductase cytochrome b subunit